MQFDFSQNRESIAGGFTEVDYAFIQFAGFTFGKAVSKFDPQWALTKPWISSGFLAGSNNTTGIPQIAYTASFGNGVSGTIALENASPYRNAGLYNTATFIVAPGAGSFTGAFYGTNSNTFFGNAYGGNHIPDVVGNLRLDQAWGTLHFAAAMHTSTAGFYGANESFGHADDVYGFAVSGAVEFKNLPTGAGDSLKIEASYAKGAAQVRLHRRHHSKRPAAVVLPNSMATRSASATCSTVCTPPAAQIQQSDAWSVSAFYEHYWNPAWRTSLFGNYSQHLLWRCRQRDARRGIQPGRRSPGNEQFVQPGLYGWQHYWHDQ
jgi:hypothetical protein